MFIYIYIEELIPEFRNLKIVSLIQECIENEDSELIILGLKCLTTIASIPEYFDDINNSKLLSLIQDCLCDQEYDLQLNSLIVLNMMAKNGIIYYYYYYYRKL